MRIGIFDSGLGGLVIAQSLIAALPHYDYLYLGDTKRLPYGNRSQEAVYEFTQEAVSYLFEQNCQLVILACNTASAEALHRIQEEYIPVHYPGRKVLGVIIPTVEAVIAQKALRPGVLATSSTIQSKAYTREIQKLDFAREVFQNAAPLLVPLIEYGGLAWSQPIIDHYLQPLKEAGVDVIVLGCTHYAAIKEQVRASMGRVPVISQDEIIAESLSAYLARHPEQEGLLSRGSTRTYQVTDLTETTFNTDYAFNIASLNLEKITLPHL